MFGRQHERLVEELNVQPGPSGEKRSEHCWHTSSLDMTTKPGTDNWRMQPALACRDLLC